MARYWIGGVAAAAGAAGLCYGFGRYLEWASGFGLTPYVNTVTHAVADVFKYGAIPIGPIVLYRIAPYIMDQERDLQHQAQQRELGNITHDTATLNALRANETSRWRLLRLLRRGP